MPLMSGRLMVQWWNDCRRDVLLGRSPVRWPLATAVHRAWARWVRPCGVLRSGLDRCDLRCVGTDPGNRASPRRHPLARLLGWTRVVVEDALESSHQSGAVLLGQVAEQRGLRRVDGLGDLP